MSNHGNQELERFKFVVLPNNQTGQLNVPLTQAPTVLATITVPADSDDDIWLNATIGWVVTAAAGTNEVVRFSIYKDNPITGTLIFSTVLGGEPGFERNYLNSFSHVDSNLPHNSEHQTYVLTAQVVDAGDAVTVQGPLTFIATVIETKRHHEEHKCEPQCKPYCKPYGQKFDFD